MAHQVTLTVERNRFESGSGIFIRTTYDNAPRTVDVIIRNNLFVDVAAPIRLSEAGLMGRVSAEVGFNTFVRFDTAIHIFGVDRGLTEVEANVFVDGTRAVNANAPYVAPLNFVSSVSMEASVRPVTGVFTEIPAPLNADYTLRADSLAVDAAGEGPPDDVGGCPRPQGAARDPGAFESH